MLNPLIWRMQVQDRGMGRFSSWESIFLVCTAANSLCCHEEERETTLVSSSSHKDTGGETNIHSTEPGKVSEDRAFLALHYLLSESLNNAPSHNGHVLFPRI